MRDAYTAVETPPGVRPGTISALGNYVPRGDHPFESIGEAYAALRHVYETAVQFLERTDLPREEAAILLRDAVHEGRITVLDYMTGQTTRLSETRRTFLAAARHALGNHNSG